MLQKSPKPKLYIRRLINLLHIQNIESWRPLIGRIDENLMPIHELIGGSKSSRITDFFADKNFRIFYGVVVSIKELAFKLTRNVKYQAYGGLEAESVILFRITKGQRNIIANKPVPLPDVSF